MSNRGFHPLPWVVVPLLLGPAVWPLAFAETGSGPPAPRLLRRGRQGPGPCDVYVVFEDDYVPEALRTQITRLKPHYRRLVLGRVVKYGGPTYTESTAEDFLARVATSLGAEDAELELLFGALDRVAQAIHNRRGFSLVLRSDQLDEIFDACGEKQTIRCLRHEVAA